jgi:hypothetical protein
MRDLSRNHFWKREAAGKVLLRNAFILVAVMLTAEKRISSLAARIRQTLS